MLRVLSDLTTIVRFDVPASAGLIDSGVTGTFVEKKGDLIDLPTAGTVGVMQVFTESYRDGTAGKWSPDVNAAGHAQLAVLYGKYRGLTDQYAGSVNAGDALKVDAAGKLIAATIADGNAVAKCTKAAHTVSHLDKDWTVIEFVTL